MIPANADGGAGVLDRKRGRGARCSAHERLLAQPGGHALDGLGVANPGGNLAVHPIVAHRSRSFADPPDA